MRADAAVTLGEAWINGVDGLPGTEALLDELVIAGESWYHFPPWMLRVLEARRDHRELDTPLRCNDLESYAHEVFDRDPSALHLLLKWGYVETVEMALAHFELLPRDAAALTTALYRDHGRQRWGTAPVPARWTQCGWCPHDRN